MRRCAVKARSRRNARRALGKQQNASQHRDQRHAAQQLFQSGNRRAYRAVFARAIMLQMRRNQRAGNNQNSDKNAAENAG